MSNRHANGSLTSPSRADRSSSPFANGNAVPPPYSDSDPHPDTTSYPARPTAGFPQPSPQRLGGTNGSATHPGGALHQKTDSGIVDPEAFEDWDDDNFDEQDPLTEGADAMPGDLRPPFHRPTDGKSGTPLLSENRKENGYAGGEMGGDGPRPLIRRKSTFKEVDPDLAAKTATRRRYTYAAFFLAVSLVSFTIQTETAVWIKKYGGWSKSYGMLYFTHGSWTMLWFLQLAILRFQKRKMPWKTFWRWHTQQLSQTALMVQYQDVNAPTRMSHINPWKYIIRTTAFVGTALTIAGGSWYVAVGWTTASDLTAIYNCSAFFAYAFSIPILKEKLRWNKMAAVGVAIVGVLIVAYGDTHPPKHGSKSGGGTGGKTGHPDEDKGSSDAENRALGNLVIGVGSVLYGFYEVLYKKYMCPPEETSPGRSMIFANTMGSALGAFTLCVLWIPMPILHWLGWEKFSLPTGHTAWMLLISVTANAIFSGSFLVLISLTSPVLSSVAALLTIFLVALVDQLLPPPLNTPLSGAAVIGGLLIIAAFLVLSWATYREMDQERKKKAEEEAAIDDSDLDDIEEEEEAEMRH